MKNKKLHHIFTLTEAEKSHVCAIYHEKDGHRLRSALYALRHVFNFKVCEPQYDGELGKFILENILRGIQESKSTLLFITKQFLSNGFLMYIGMFAVMQCLKTKGQHRVIPVVLDPCKKVPIYFSFPNCILVWKYERKLREFSWKEELLIKEVSDRIKKAFIGPPMTPKLLKSIRKKIIPVRRPCSFMERINKIKSIGNHQTFPRRIFSFLFHVTELTEMLPDILLCCGQGQCHFICRGEDFPKLYNHREKYCEYFPRQCEYCTFKGRKRLMIRHKQTCKGKMDSDWLNIFRPILPEQNHKKRMESEKSNSKPNRLSQEKSRENDQKDLKEINESFDQVNYVGCRHYGCTDTCLPKNLQHHLEHCCFKPSECKYVSSGCPYDGPKFEMDKHILHCEFRPEPCPNCKKVFQKRHLRQHIDICGTGKFLSTIEKNLKEIFRLDSPPPESKTIETKLPEGSTNLIGDLSIPDLLAKLNPSEGERLCSKTLEPESEDEEQTRPLLKHQSSTLEPSMHPILNTHSISRPSAHFQQTLRDKNCNPPKLSDVSKARRRFALLGREDVEDNFEFRQGRIKISKMLYN